MVLDQIQCYFTVNKLTTDFQHAYREGHSTYTALTQTTAYWLREMYDRNIFTPTLLDFSVALDIIANSLPLEKCMCYGFTPSAILWLESDLSNRPEGVL